MYNPQLDTFLQVARLGSFSRAAEALYITPSAVIQQMNALETDLGVRLFVRTQRGTELTAAGELLRSEGTRLVEECERLRRRLLSLEASSRKEVSVGISMVHQCKMFYKLWTLFLENRADYQVKIKAVPNRVKLGEEIDFMEGPLYEEQYVPGKNFVKLSEVACVCAVWKEHPLAKKPLLRYEDMQGMTMVTVGGPGLYPEVMRLNEEVEKHGVSMVYLEHYDFSVFSMCITNGYLLHIPACWETIHPELVAIPCEWDYSLPYGLFHKENPSPAAQEFLAFVEEQRKSQDFSLV